jgi:transcription elongation factor Elf1
MSTKVKVDVDLKVFIGTVWPRIAEMDKQDLMSARLDSYNDVIDLDLEIEKCPFCGSFLLQIEQDGVHHFHMTCKDCGARSRCIDSGKFDGEVLQLFESIDFPIDSDVKRFAENDVRSMTDNDWQHCYSLFSAFLDLLAIWITTECWNRRA